MEQKRLSFLSANGDCIVSPSTRSVEAVKRFESFTKTWVQYSSLRKQGHVSDAETR